MKFKYINKIKYLLSIIEEKEYENMSKSVNILVDSILDKKSIYIFGASHAGILSQEMFYRAGGLIVVSPIFASEVLLNNSPITLTSKMERCEGYGTILASTIDFNQNDVLILHSVSGRNPITIEMAIAAKAKGVTVIGITNLQYSKSVASRHSLRKNMFEYCDVILDNHGDIGDACVDIDGLEQKVSPTSTVIGSAILNSIVAEVAQELVSKGITHPPIFYSANLDGGDELNQTLYDEYKQSIHYKF